MTLYLEALRDGLHDAMAESENVVIVGEDILDPYGGAFKVTKGLSTRFPERIFPTPIAESAIVGLCTGLALRGMRPVGEIMFGDFMTLCMDQIVNSASKFPLMYRNRVSVPWVIRTPMGGARGYGPTHSQSLEKLFFGIPGLTVVAPSRAHDPRQMIRVAILQETSPILFIEDKGDYAARLFGADDSVLRIRELFGEHGMPTMVVENFSLEAKQQADVCILAYGGAASLVSDVLKSIVDEEIYGSLIVPARINDPATLQRAVESLLPKIPLLIVEQGTERFNWASEIMAMVHTDEIERFGQSGRRIQRLAAAPDAIPSSRTLEAQIIVTKEKITSALYGLLS